MKKDFKNAKILLVDDEQEALDIFTRQLKPDYNITTTTSANKALDLIEYEKFHIILTDVVMPEMNGIEFMKKVKKIRPEIPFIMISGKATIKTAVESLKLGAEDFIEKPVEDLEILNLTINKILKSQWQLQEIERLKKLLNEDFNRDKVIGNSTEIQKILYKVKKIAPLDITVLITGETGVGKEVIANLIHRNSKRKVNKFVPVNCGSVPEQLLESILFGHKKGSFTDAIRDKVGYFEEASGGTLFLDEILDTSKAFQVKLLRALETETIRRIGDDKDIKVDVRILAATNKDIEKAIEAGEFRKDLYYRLNVVNIHIPPLRQRKEDIILLSQNFLNRYKNKYNKGPLEFTEAVKKILTNYTWHGNIRELKNTIEHAVALASHNKIMPDDLPDHIHKVKKFDIRNLFDKPYPIAKENFEIAYIKNLLDRYNGKITKIAQVSEIKRQNLYQKFNKYDIDVDKYRGE